MFPYIHHCPCCDAEWITTEDYETVDPLDIDMCDACQKAVDASYEVEPQEEDIAYDAYMRNISQCCCDHDDPDDLPLSDDRADPYNAPNR